MTVNSLKLVEDCDIQTFITAYCSYIIILLFGRFMTDTLMLAYKPLHILVNKNFDLLTDAMKPNHWKWPSKIIFDQLVGQLKYQLEQCREIL